MTDLYTKRQLQIIYAAVELIAAEGMQNLTMKHIAAAIQVTEPALYRHFKSKQEILLGVISLIRQNGKVPEKSDKSGWDLIECIMLTRIASYTAIPGLTAIIFSEEIFSGDNSLSEQIKTLMQKTQEKFKQLILVAQQSGSIRQDIQAEQISLLVIGSFRFLVTQWHLFKHDFDLNDRAVTLFRDLRKLLVVS